MTFSDLKPNFIPFYIQNTHENVNFWKKNLNILKNTLHRPHKDTLFTYVSNNKRSINENVVLYAPKLSAHFYTTYTQHTDFIFGPNLVPPKSLHNKFQIFHSLFTPQVLKKNKVFEL